MRNDNFYFASKGATAYQLKGFGLATMIWSFIIIANTVSSPLDDKRVSLQEIPFHVVLWLIGFLICYVVCEVEIEHGEFRYRRLRTWRVTALEAVERVCHIYGPIVYVKIKDSGKTKRMIFNLGWNRGQPYPPPVIDFLKRFAGDADIVR